MSDRRILEQRNRLHFISKDLRQRSGCSRKFESLVL